MALTAAAHRIIGILPLGQKQKFGLATVFHARQCGLQRPSGRFTPRLITIKAKYHFRAEAIDTF